MKQKNILSVYCQDIIVSVLSVYYQYIGSIHHMYVYHNEKKDEDNNKDNKRRDDVKSEEEENERGGQ